MFYNITDSENCADSQHQDGNPAANMALKRENKRLFIIAIAAVVLFAVLFASIFIFRPGGEVYGNTSGNIANLGLATEKDGWIYYCDSITDGCLYKVKPDGSEKTKLKDGACLFINVVDSWIYYNDKNSGNLCKMHTDGTGFKKLADSSGIAYVEEGWVYYKSEYIYKMRTDGTEKTQVSSNRAGLMTVADGWIYYTDLDEASSLCKIRVENG